MLSFKSSIACAVFTACLVMLPVSGAVAQLPQTQLSALSPPGGKVGSTFDVKVSAGANLEDLSQMVVNHPGIKAVQKMQESKGVKTPVTNTFTVTIAANVPPGSYEARVQGLYGLSSPRTFVVGLQNELSEAEPNNTLDKAGSLQPNMLLNGSIGGGADIDFFKFPGKKGERIILCCRANSIDSRMQAALELYDSAGKRLGFSRQQVRREPMVDVTLPADGEYFVKVYDFLYRGGADYFYRLSLGTGPYIDYVMPPAGVPGSNGKFTLYGRNLPGGQSAGLSVDGRPLEKLDVTITLPKDSSTLKLGENLAPYESILEGMTYTLKTPSGVSNPVLIQFAQSAVQLEKEPNDVAAQSQSVTVPVEFVGQFQKRGDIDHLTFEAKAKEVYTIEVFSQRGGSLADPYLTLEQITKNSKGEESSKRIATLDDNGTNLAPNVFDTLSDDPVYRFGVPADGTYRISIRDRYFESRGDPRLVYRLSIRKERPDFQLVALPMTPPAAANQPGNIGTIGLRKGENLGIQIYAFRKDGFKESIEISAEGLPKGVICHPAIIGSGLTNTQLIFTAAEDAPEWSGSIRVIGKSRIEDQARLQAVASAKTALKAAAVALAASEAAATQAAQALKILNAELAKTRQAALKSTKDKSIADTIAALKKTTTTVEGTATQLNTALAAARKKVTEIQTALNTSEVDSVRHLVHDARSATILFNGSTTVPAISRLSRTLGLSVLNEPAPYQVTSDFLNVVVNQGSQILIPVKLAKRTGFDNQVALTFVVSKSSKFQVQNKPIPKGKNSELLRLFIKKDSPVGTHTLYLKTQGQVSYRRNLIKYNLAKAEQSQVAKTATAAADVAKKAVQARDTVAKKVAADAEVVKKSTAAKTNAAKASATAANAVKQVTAEKVKAEESAVKAAEILKLVSVAADAAKRGAESDAKDKALTEAYIAVQKAAVTASETVKKLNAAKVAAQNKFTDSEIAAKKAAATVVTAQKSLTTAETTAKTSAAAKTKADAAVKVAEASSKSAADKKTAVDKSVAALEKSNKPKNINIFPPSTPLVVTVKRAPVTLSASVPGGGNLKRGAKLDVKVTVKRINGFAGPVTLTLPLPPGVIGLSAKPVTIPADKTTGFLSVQAAGDATEGQLANLVIRATMDFEGKAAVDAPIKVKVAK
jgi:hypothetical protein